MAAEVAGGELGDGLHDLAYGSREELGKDIAEDDGRDDADHDDGEYEGIEVEEEEIEAGGLRIYVPNGADDEGGHNGNNEKEGEGLAFEAS